jgi:hypothetical protein
MIGPVIIPWRPPQKMGGDTMTGAGSVGNPGVAASGPTPSHHYWLTAESRIAYCESKAHFKPMET